MVRVSKAEKEAIEVLKEMQEICKHKTYIENEERSEWQREYKAVDTILNLIDKLQKENEALGRTLDDEIADNDRLQENNLSYQKELAKAWKENAELKEEIDNLIKENHKHIDYIADMKKKFKQRIRNLVQEYKPNQSNTFIESQERYIELVKKLELLGE